MTAADIQIFDASGAPIPVPDEVRATLTPLQCELLDNVQQAAHAERVATAAHAAALKRLHAAVKAHAAVMALRDQSLPRLTQRDLLLAMGMTH